MIGSGVPVRPIEGERVLLRPMEERDTDDVVRMRSEPSVHAQLFSAEPPTRESHLRWLEQMQRRGDRQEFVIVDRASGRRVGTIGLSDIDCHHRRAEYGVLIGEPDARGKGLAAEASRLLLRHAFEGLGLRRVELRLFADNTPALRLYRRLGFVSDPAVGGTVVKDGRARATTRMWLDHERWMALGGA